MGISIASDYNEKEKTFTFMAKFATGTGDEKFTNWVLANYKANCPVLVAFRHRLAAHRRFVKG